MADPPAVERYMRSVEEHADVRQPDGSPDPSYREQAEDTVRRIEEIRSRAVGHDVEGSSTPT